MAKINKDQVILLNIYNKKTYNKVLDKNKIKFQTIDIDFPKNLWAVIIWFVTEDKTKIPYCLTLAKNSKKEAIEYATKTVLESKKRFGKEKVLDYSILIPLKFYETHPLKKEYWELPPEENIEIDNNVSLTRCLLKPASYFFLITPTRFIDKGNKIFLTCAFAVEKENKELLPDMMKLSDHPVCAEAKSVALYTLGIPFTYDLINKKVFVKGN